MHRVGTEGRSRWAPATGPASREETRMTRFRRRRRAPRPQARRQGEGGAAKRASKAAPRQAGRPRRGREAPPTAPPQPPPAPERRRASAPRRSSCCPTDQREALEKLSLNLARAAMTAQGAIAEAALRQADRPAALTPDPFHVAPAPDRGDGPPRRPARPADARPGRPLQPLHGPLEGGRAARRRRSGGRGRRAGQAATSASPIRTGPTTRSST